MNKNFICNLFIAVLFCCGFTANAQSLRDEGVSAKLAPWKNQFKAASVGYVYGDVNGDEKTDISDVVTIINAIAQNDKSKPRADVNEDGVIDISDVVKVINIMAGLDTPPITVDKSSLDMTTGESEDVRIVWVSGSGDYEVTNENPDIVTVEWLSNSSTASERRKVKAAGETEIGEGNSFSADGFLKVYALQPGQAKITVVDKNTSKKLIVSITVTADYNTEIFTDFCPNNATYVVGSAVACTFGFTPPSTGELKCRIILSEEPDMSGTTQAADITINGTEGEKAVYNEKGETTTFSNLKSDTKYYWRITYYDTRSGSYMNGSPINWFKTITTEDPAVAAGLCPDGNHPHIIDMGEAGKWACCNVGASTPWENGGYYAWGETEEKEGYDWSTYIHCDGSEDSCHDLGSNISGTQYDVAHVKWGGKWCMPSNQQIHLLENCSSEWTELNGINGRKFTAPNGGTIFLPAAGGRYRYNDPDDVYSDGSYWSSSQCPSPSYYAYFLQFGSDFTRWYGSYRRIGRSVRPVIDQSESLDPAVESGLCPDSNHPHVIDMGDAGKWACCNVGASAPWEYGGYYAWGETEEKESYSWKNYIHCDGSYDTCHDLGEDIAGTECDVAHVKWGGNWCMPSRIQQDNLIQNCSSEWTSLNGVFGRKYISPDGGAIFLPAAGYTRYEESMSINEDGNYWSSTPYGYVTDKNSQAAFYLNFNNNKNEWYFTARVWGRTVRPVIYESEPDFEPEPEDPANLCPDENHPHIIDMGDAGKWACCNVGASAPWEYGGYYAWGETEEKDNYSVETYIHCNGSIETCHAIGDDIAGTEYDVAHVKWGDLWCLPSIEQIKNLLNHSTSEWRTVNGIKGIKFTAPNGRTIFLPAAAGYNSDDVGVLGYYWSSRQNPNELYYAYSLNFNPTDSYWSNSNTRNYGFSVRPVISEDPAVTAGLCPDENHPHIIDMGEAGKWACCNVGASAPWEYGGYYAWGETEEKDNYSWETYIHCDGSYDTCHDLGEDISGTQYDVAHVKWGGKWRMPNHDQQMLLLDNCSSEWTEVNGIYGSKFTAPNGGTIFLPAAGDRWSDELSGAGHEGYYWSSTQNPSYSSDAYYLYFTSGYMGWKDGYRHRGRGVRPVTE